MKGIWSVGSARMGGIWNMWSSGLVTIRIVPMLIVPASVIDQIINQ